MKRKVIVVTGSRADYGLVKTLTQLFEKDTEFETFLAATGSHFSQKHGHTIDVIRKDKIRNIIEVDMKMDGDQAEDINRYIAVGINGFADLYKKLRPEFIVVLGDRYELWAACIPATLFNIPIVHLHGGESTQGVIDESVRHSITKMAHLHFCSHDLYKKRIIQMGENPDNVHNVGAVGLDRIKNLDFLTRADLEKQFGFPFSAKNILCTFHPVTLNANESALEIQALTDAIEKCVLSSDVKFFITLPNADTNSSMIREKWDIIIKKYPDKIHDFTNLGDLLYLSLMKQVDLILGNSSSGILEAPYLNKAVVDVGLRQAGRLRSGHIIHANGKRDEISFAIDNALSSDFQKKLAETPSIYGNGNASSAIYNRIKKTDFKSIIYKIFKDGP